MNDWSLRAEEYRAFTEAHLASFFQYAHEPQKVLFDSMRYSLLAGGKRLRPTLVYDFCRMSGADWKVAADFAAAIEMVHTYSLIHDDLPCMDNDDFRRGKPTNHKIYGEAMATLAGDGLLTAAFSTIANSAFSAQQKSQAVCILAQCAGETGMVGGQALDIMSESRTCTEQEVLDIQSRKTGALIKAACCLGVVAANGSADQLEAAGVFAEHLGLAFQIRDDVLDVIGSSAELGKSVGTDGCKNTFVRLYGIEECNRRITEHSKAAASALSAFSDNEFMLWLTQSLIDRMA